MTGARRAGATLFLAPADNCGDVVRDGIPAGLTVAKVSTLAEAVSAVEAYVAGKPVTPCETTPRPALRRLSATWRRARLRDAARRSRR